MRTLLLSLVWLLTVLGLLSSSPESELLILNTLYAECGGTNTKLVGWGTTSPVCSSLSNSTLTGVTCVGGQVVGLKIDKSSLKGSIPSAIGGLTGLTSLNLAFNALSGSIPSSVGALTGLTLLQFGSNSLSGTIPSALGGLSALTSLILDHNSLQGTLPGAALKNLTALSVVKLHYNLLDGTLPTEIGLLTKLTYLNAYANKIKGSLPEQLGNLAAAEVIELGYNYLSGGIPSQLASCHSLSYLALSRNSLSGTIPPSLGSLTNLVALKLDGNELVGAIPETLCARTYVCPRIVFWFSDNIGLNCYPPCMNSLDSYQLQVSNGVGACTQSPTAFPTALPTIYPTNLNTMLPLQFKFASFQVSQTFQCVGTVAAACSSTALYQIVLPAVNAKLWARYADRETDWLPEKSVADCSVTFNEVGVSGNGFLVSYFYTFRPIDLKMSSMEAVRLSFQRAVASNLAAYNDELDARQQTSSEQLTCVAFEVSRANLALGVPTAFPTSAVFEPMLLNVGAQIVLGSSLGVALVVMLAVWWLRSGLQRQCDQDEESEKIVAFQPFEFFLPIVVAITTAASNVVQVFKFYNDAHTVALAAVMIASRLAVALYSAGLVWGMLKRKSLRNRLAATLLDHRLVVWLLVGFVTLLDPANLRFFPWIRGPFAERSRGFPTKALFKLCNLCTAANALVQFLVSAFAKVSFASVASLVLSLLLFVSTLFTVSVRMTAEKVRARSRLAESTRLAESPSAQDKSSAPAPSPLHLHRPGNNTVDPMDLESAKQKIAHLTLALEKLQDEYAEHQAHCSAAVAHSPSVATTPRRLLPTSGSAKRPTLVFDEVYHKPPSTVASAARSSRDSEVIFFDNEIHDGIPKSNQKE